VNGGGASGGTPCAMRNEGRIAEFNREKWEQDHSFGGHEVWTARTRICNGRPTRGRSRICKKDGTVGGRRICKVCAVGK
jgi:hypothetical protein